MSDRYWGSPPAEPEGRVRARRGSFALAMPDGVRLAVDLYLPEAPLPPGGRPTILRQTRYYRSLAPWPCAERLGLCDVLENLAPMRRRFLAAGYAWVDVDVRGSGASAGHQPHPWTVDEVADGGRVVDWIVAQAWSSGRVGALGVSYDGTCADHLAALRHPAVRAIAPLFSLFDAYADVGFPGGVHLSWFTETWSQLNALLDLNRYDEALAFSLWITARATLRRAGAARSVLERTLGAVGLLGRVGFDRVVGVLARPLQRGVRPLDEDARGELLSAALADHRANGSVHQLARCIHSRDETFYLPEDGSGPVTIDDLSPHAAFARGGGPLEGTAIYSISGWRDGGYPAAAARRHIAHGGPLGRLTLGPWVHGGKMAVRAFAAAVPARFDFAGELLRFFDAHLWERPRGTLDGESIHYFTLVEGSWKTAPCWPPPGFAPWPLPLSGTGRLGPEPEEGCDRLPVDPAVGTGERSRWRSLVGMVPGDYPDRAERDRRLLVYDSPPLAAPLEVTGHPVAVMHAAWEGATDGQLFVYLEDVAPDGRVAYVTEGQLRALHRRTRGADLVPGLPAHTCASGDAARLGDGESAELTVPLLPVSWLFREGHRIRLAVAGCDADHFAPLPGAATLALRRGREHPSRIELPVCAAPVFHGAVSFRR